MSPCLHEVDTFLCRIIKARENEKDEVVNKMSKVINVFLQVALGLLQSVFKRRGRLKMRSILLLV